MLPQGSKRGTSYAKWLSHPLIQEVAIVSKKQFKFKNTGTGQTTNNTRAMHRETFNALQSLMRLAGEYVNKEKLSRNFMLAPSQLGYPPQRPQQLKLAVTRLCTLRGLCSPKHYPKAAEDTAIAWSPATSTEDFTTGVQHTSSRYRPDKIMHTDGSRKDIPDMGPVTGSGVYSKLSTAHLNLKGHPYGQGMLNTITRAEMVAL